MNIDTCPLSALAVGESGRVAAVDVPGEMGRRLLELGLVEGGEVDCLFRSPAGDPTAYLIRGAVIALRCKDAAGVRVERRRES